MKRAFWLMLALCLALSACAFAQEEREVTLSALTIETETLSGTVRIAATEIDGETFLFLPAFADLEKMTLSLNGQRVEWEETGETDDGDILIEAAVNPDETVEITVMQSENLRSLFLFSDDPVNQGRAYIDNCDDHEHFTTASMALVDEAGRVNHTGAIRKLRGRGNGTWSGSGNSKNPYQFKLEERADLLDTGLASEKERTWLLLAEASDMTHLHNRITMDLGLELGLTETSRTEHIDLYYDGEYRGIYLLAEKTEIGAGRVNELDYDDLIETWNDKVGQTDLESLPVAQGINRFGNPYTYIDGVVESSHADAGAFLLEMEMAATTLSDRCYFQLSDGGVIASKNPENATQTMMEYISTRLQEARDTLENGGVNPENGRTIADDFDVEAFVRTMLVQELSYNYDGYRYSSSFFVLPAEEKRFRPGPLWDFDIAYRYMANGLTADGAGFKETSGWMHAFYQCPSFVEMARKIYADELYPMVRDILLGDGEGVYLQSIDAYTAEIIASIRMDERLWGPSTQLNRYLYGRGHEGELALLKQFLTQRSEWLLNAFGENPHGENGVVLWTNAVYTHVDESLRVLERPWNPAVVQNVSWEQISEATEEDYAVWQMEILLTPDEDCKEPVILLNGAELPHEQLEDGTLRVCATFEDPSYRPVDYYGEDIGLVYNYEHYAAMYPEVAEECEYDEQMVMDYFCDEGMYEDHMGNAFFRPSDVLAAHPEMEYTLGEDWWTYYWDFIYYGHDTDKWLMYMGNKSFWPDVQNAL